MSAPVLHYVFDPLCGWCYAARPLLRRLIDSLGDALPIRFHPGLLFASPRTIDPAYREHIIAADRRIAAVAGECAMADLTATLRLQLAAEESGVPGLLLRPSCRQPGSSSCATRWQIKPATSLPNGLPGLGSPRWQVELLKARGGRPGSWMMEWREKRLHIVEAPVQEKRAPGKQQGAVLSFAKRA